MILGCIADDLTGATDLGLMLSRGGMSVVQVVGVPETGEVPADVDAVVVALKSRTIRADEAVRMSLASAQALLGVGATQILFKYCSTFDSTDKGNIGPVLEALARHQGVSFTVATPAFPATGRSVYRGHLFVGDRLLSESPMKDHPLTPMRDPDLVRVLQRQTTLKVGLVPYEVVDQGAEAIAAAFKDAQGQGIEVAILDALTDRHLTEIGRAIVHMPLISGGSGIALGLPDAYRAAGRLDDARARRPFAAPGGASAILAGSCSAATRSQVAYAIDAGLPALRLDPERLAEGSQSAAGVIEWATARLGQEPVLIYSTAEPEAIARAQSALGRERAAGLVEQALAAIAEGLAGRGVTRFIIAGGETSGAVVEALGIKALEIGPEIDPGVPWTLARSGPRACLALKSGNFGAQDFFIKAWDVIR